MVDWGRQGVVFAIAAIYAMWQFKKQTAGRVTVEKALEKEFVRARRVATSILKSRSFEVMEANDQRGSVRLSFIKHPTDMNPPIVVAELFPDYDIQRQEAKRGGRSRHGPPTYKSSRGRSKKNRKEARLLMRVYDAAAEPLVRTMKKMSMITVS